MKKHVPYEKLSKKARREMDAKKSHLGRDESREPHTRKDGRLQQK